MTWRGVDFDSPRGKQCADVWRGAGGNLTECLQITEREMGATSCAGGNMRQCWLEMHHDHAAFDVLDRVSKYLFKGASLTGAPFPIGLGIAVTGRLQVAADAEMARAKTEAAQYFVAHYGRGVHNLEDPNLVHGTQTFARSSLWPSMTSTRPSFRNQLMSGLTSTLSSEVRRLLSLRLHPASLAR